MIALVLLLFFTFCVSSCAVGPQVQTVLPKEEDDAAWKLLHQLVAPDVETMPNRPERDLRIPETWEFSFSIFTGDYLAMVSEKWTLSKRENSAELRRELWRNYDPKTKWGRTKYERWKAITPQQADILLKALLYAVMPLDLELPEDSSHLKSGRTKGAIGFYYPAGSAKLATSDGRELWRFGGFHFTLTDARALWMGDASYRVSPWYLDDPQALSEHFEVARIYLLLTQRFPDGKNWQILKTVADPRPEKKAE